MLKTTSVQLDPEILKRARDIYGCTSSKAIRLALDYLVKTKPSIVTQFTTEKPNEQST